MAQKIKPFFSVIIPALNEAKYLPHLLTDLKAQTFRDFEIIVVDGKSDDKTVAKANSFRPSLPSLTILESAKRHVCTQRNLGAANANADWLIFMDADNRLPPFFLQGIKYRIDSSSANIISCYLQPDKNTPGNLTVARAINTFFDLQNELQAKFLLEAMIVVNQKCFKAIGGFDESVNYAEGKSFIQKAISLGFVYKHFRDPVWTYSFRRFRKYGILGSAARSGALELFDFLKIDNNHTRLTRLYPMEGGKFFNSSREKNILIQKAKKLLSTILED